MSPPSRRYFAAVGAALTDDEFGLIVGEVLEACQATELAAATKLQAVRRGQAARQAAATQRAAGAIVARAMAAGAMAAGATQGGEVQAAATARRASLDERLKEQARYVVESSHRAPVSRTQGS